MCSNMSSDGRDLAGWIEALTAALDHADAVGAAQLRRLAGRRRARITLDEQTVLVEFVGHDLVVRPDDPAVEVDGEGATTSAVVVAILDGSVEVSHAVEDGLVTASGAIDDVLRLFAIVETLLAGSSRVPRLRDLAEEFVAARRDDRAPAGSEPDVAGRPTAPHHAARRRAARAARSRAAEIELLSTLDLLPDGRGPAPTST